MNFTSNPFEPKNKARELLSPYTLLYFVLAALINLGLGYEFSVIYAVGLGCFFLLLGSYLPRLQKAVLFVCTLTAAFYYPFGRVFGPPNFNSILSLYSTNPEEAGEMMQIFPYWDYLIAVFIMILGIFILRRKTPQIRRWTMAKSLFLFSFVGALLLAPVTNLRAGGEFKLSDTGYPVVRFVEDVSHGKKEVEAEMARMKELSSVPATWHVDSVKANRQVLCW